MSTWWNDHDSIGHTKQPGLLREKMRPEPSVGSCIHFLLIDETQFGFSRFFGRWTWTPKLFMEWVGVLEDERSVADEHFFLVIFLRGRQTPRRTPLSSAKASPR